MFGLRQELRVFSVVFLFNVCICLLCFCGSVRKKAPGALLPRSSK